MTDTGPRATYETRLAENRAASADMQRRDDGFANLRGVTFVAGVLLFALARWWDPARFLWGPALAVPFVLFAILIYLHDRVIRAHNTTKRIIEFYERGLARLDHTWIGKGKWGSAFLDPEHTYALDLDIFGKGSLFELLCTAQTRSGEHTLAAWLLNGATPDTLRDRHQAVAELRERLQLREDLSLLTQTLRDGVHPELIARWGSAPRLLSGNWIRWAAALLALVNVVLLIGWLAEVWGPAPLLISLLVSTLGQLPIAKRIRAVRLSLRSYDRELVVVGQVAKRFLDERYTCRHLVELQNALTADGFSAPQQIRRFERLVRLLDQLRNQMFIPIGFLLLWDLQFTFAIESWRARVGPRIEGWLAAIGEAEALLAIASYAYEHPADPLPEIADTAEPVFDGVQLGHPLLPEATAIRNDVRLTEGVRVLVVSGSNMSGKSTLLRTVGINTVLALAGAPVRATRLRLVPLSIGATLRVQDNLLQGSSRFYAEIRRLKQILDLTSTMPDRHVLFLLDEIMHGTNSHDRLIGATAIVKSLVERGAIGLVTTHDLALADVVAVLGGRAVNVHFEDQLVDGQLSFDYRMRPGVVERSNAIALMRAVGLDV